MSDTELHIVCTDREGVTHTLPALEGWRVMEIIRDNGLPIKAECGGALECATCHVYVANQWWDKLIAKSTRKTRSWTRPSWSSATRACRARS